MLLVKGFPHYDFTPGITTLSLTIDGAVRALSTRIRRGPKRRISRVGISHTA